jgi:hypothetical protein
MLGTIAPDKSSPTSKILDLVPGIWMHPKLKYPGPTDVKVFHTLDVKLYCSAIYLEK